MAIHYTIDSAAGILIATLSGDVTAEDFRDYFETSADDRSFRPDLQRLIVIRDVRSFPKSPQMRAIAARIRPRTADLSVHLAVVTDTVLGRGMTAMIMGNAGLADRYQEFDDVTSAALWLVLASHRTQSLAAAIA